MHFTYMRYICLSRVDLCIQLNKVCQSENVTFNQIVIFAIFSHCSYTSSSPVVSYPDTHGTGRRVMKAVTVSLMKWGVNPLLIAGIFPVPILSPWQFQVLVPFQRQPQPPAVPALARRWPHHIVAPNGAIVDRAQVSLTTDLPWWILSTVWVCSILSLVFFSDSGASGSKVVRVARSPMGGWAEDSQVAPRHHDPVPEESSEDEMPPHVHKVNTFHCSL